MAKRLIVLSALTVLTLVAASYVLRAQTVPPPKNDVRLQIEVSQNGAVVATPVLSIADGGTGTMTLKDGTEIKITATSVARSTVGR